MTMRTWVGGFSNGSASDPKNWSPSAAPQAGDTLIMHSSPHQMAISGNDLAGDTLTINNPGYTGNYESIALSDNATANIAALYGANAGSIGIQVNGTDTLNVSTAVGAGATAFINLAAGATLTGTFDMETAGINISSNGTGATLVNDGASHIVGSGTGTTPQNRIGTDITGKGSWTLSSYSSVPSELELAGAVSSGQTFTLGADTEKHSSATIDLDHPQTFAGSVTLNPGGQVNLAGITGLTGYTFDGSSMVLYVGDTAVETLSLTKGSGISTSSSPVGLYVYNTPTGSQIAYNYQKPGNVPLRPVPLTGGGGGSSGSSDNNSSAVASNTSTTVVTPTTVVSVPAPPASNPPAVNTTNNNTVVVNSSPSATASSVSNPIVVANGGNTPTPLSPAEQAAVSAAAGLNPSAGGAMTFFYDGAHVGGDFNALGQCISSGQDQTACVNQCVTDLKQLLSVYVASTPSIGTGVGVPGGPQLAIPGQFVIDVINTSFKAISIGDAGLDHAYAGALNQFFGTEASVMMGAGHA